MMSVSLLLGTILIVATGSNKDTYGVNKIPF